MSRCRKDPPRRSILTLFFLLLVGALLFRTSSSSSSASAPTFVGLTGSNFTIIASSTVSAPSGFILSSSVDFVNVLPTSDHSLRAALRPAFGSRPSPLSVSSSPAALVGISTSDVPTSSLLFRRLQSHVSTQLQSHSTPFVFSSRPSEVSLPDVVRQLSSLLAGHTGCRALVGGVHRRLRSPLFPSYTQTSLAAPPSQSQSHIDKGGVFGGVVNAVSECLVYPPRGSVACEIPPSSSSSSSSSASSSAAPVVSCVPSLYSIDGFGRSVSLPYCTHGPSAAVLRSLLDERYRPEMEVREALELVRTCFEEVERRGGGDRNDCVVKVVDENGIWDGRT